jgi:predicted nuclease of predicted toxin-antitoxin system
MRIWIDAQLSPAIAAWINRNFEQIEAESVRAVGLRDALDQEIFKQAKAQQVVVMSKDSDFIKLIEQHGPPPKIIWITCGNTSNAKMREILSQTLLKAKELLEQGEAIVEISDRSTAG